MTKLLLPRLFEFLGRLRFPQLFVAFAVVFLLDVLVPDMIPFVDELLFGLMALLLAAWKRPQDVGGGGRTARGVTIEGEAERVAKP